MGVRQPGGLTLLMGMIMVIVIMLMIVIVNQQSMRMAVFMLLTHQQPGTSSHEECHEHKLKTEAILEEKQG